MFGSSSVVEILHWNKICSFSLNNLNILISNKTCKGITYLVILVLIETFYYKQKVNALKREIVKE